MVPVIDKRKTGEQIRKYMNLRGLTVQDVKSYLSLGCGAVAIEVAAAL